jgi:serine/threonine-protein phosphatase PGAM5
VGKQPTLWLLALIMAAGPMATGEEATESGVRTVYLIRHGDYNDQDERDPEVGKALVPIGVAQARLLGARLRGLPVDFSSLTSSTMTRARQTALVIEAELPHLELVTTPLISECTPTTWREDIMEEETPEDVAACDARLNKAFKTVLAPSPDKDRHDLVVCHGNVIRYFVTRALKVDPHAWLGMSIGNCSLTVIKVFPDGAMKVLSFSDVGHIPPNLQTGTWPAPPRDLVVP